MPELPEVETVVRSLRPRICGRSISGLLTGENARRLRRPWRGRWQHGARRITGIRRRGKWIILDLEEGRALVIHLGMTGRLLIVQQRTPWTAHTHLSFVLKPGRDELRFEDVRRFGSVSSVPGAKLDKFFEDMHLGPEPSDLTARALFERMTKTRRCLKAILLDQRVVAGVGNIYADESLFEARLHPARQGSSLTVSESEHLRRAIVAVLQRAIDKKGSSIRDYLDGNGEPGSYQEEFRVYDRTGEPCPRCKTPIEQIRLAGRSTHFCPTCQMSGERRS